MSRSRKPRLLLRLPWLVVAALAWSTPAADASIFRVSEPTDFWVTYDEPTLFSARTFDVVGGWSDPMLWLYDAAGVLLAWNDDYFGLQSRIEVQVGAGSYRLRAGVCCFDPNAWRSGMVYDLSTDGSPVGGPSTTTSTSTTVEETTTVVETSTSLEVTTTSSLLPVPVSEVSSSVPQSSSTVVEESTTTTTELSSTTMLDTVPVSTTVIQETSTSSSLVDTTVEAATSVADPASTTEVPAVAETTVPTTSVSTSTPTVPTRTIPAPIREVTTSTQFVDTTTTVPETTILTTILTNTTEVAPSTSSGVGLVDPKPAGTVAAPPPVGSDDYVPEGSTITVAQRRVVVAATAVMFILPAPSMAGQRSSGSKRRK